MKVYQASVLSRGAHMPTTAVTVLGMLGTPAAVYPRPNYTLHMAQVVVDWLNGQDRPLPWMVGRAHDPWDPINRQHAHPHRPRHPR